MTVEFVHDIHDQRLAPFAGMRDAQLRGDEGAGAGLFIGESDKVINRALDAGVRPACLFMEQKWVPKTQALIDRISALDPTVPILTTDKDTFKQITGYEVTRGAVAALIRPELPAIDAVLKDAKRIVVLEDVMNATNIGAIFRSAAALGIDAVLLSPRCHDPLYRRAARVSMGTIFQVPWTRIGTEEEGSGWVAESIPLLKDHGFTTIAMALVPEALPLDDPRLADHEKIALIMGTEAWGLNDATVKTSDYAAIIPMTHNVDSLNVAAASAVAFWELRIREQ